MTETTEPTYMPCDVDEPIVLDDAERQSCEVYTRVMGYHRPVGFFNVGKQQEHRDRAYFSTRKAEAGEDEE